MLVDVLWLASGFGACVVWVFAGLRGAGLVVCVDGWLGCLAISFWLVVCVIAGWFLLGTCGVGLGGGFSCFTVRLV